MSIYSGFATRAQEENYDQLVEDMIFVLQKRILKFYKKEEANEEKFLDVLVHLHQQMAKMEESKYLEPKTSKSFEDLLRFLIKNPSKQEPIRKSQLCTTALIERKDRKSKISRKCSDTLLDEHHLSIGKIVKQINSVGEKEESGLNQTLSDSRNTFINKKSKKLVTEEKSLTKELYKNPEEQEYLEKHKTIQQFKSRFEKFNALNPINSKERDCPPTFRLKSNDKEKEWLIEDTEKNNQNFMRGYRRRSIKTGSSKNNPRSYEKY